MQLTISEIAKIFNVSIDQVFTALQEAGIANLQGQTLSEAQMDKLRTVLFRYYRPGKPAFCTVSDIGPVDSLMESLVLEKKIMIDTCSLMHERCREMLGLLVPALQRHQKKIIIPEKVIGELKKHQCSFDNSMKSASANEGMELCKMLQKAGCLSIRGSENDHFADNVFFVAFSSYRYQHHMLLITQDRRLAFDILQLNSFCSAKGYPVEAAYIAGDGQLLWF